MNCQCHCHCSNDPLMHGTDCFLKGAHGDKCMHCYKHDPEREEKIIDHTLERLLEATL